MKDAILALEDGTTIEGKGFGKEGISKGELVFATPYTGYEEAMTDPSYRGQLLMFTYPLIGNYGISYEHMQSDTIQTDGVVVREVCLDPNHRNSKTDIESFLKEHNKRGISEIDTRKLTTRTRRRGTVKASMMVGETDKEKAIEVAKNLPDITERQLIEKVTTQEPYRMKGDGPRIALIDTGVKQNILNNLKRKGFDLFVYPLNTSPLKVEGCDPDAIFVTNGPGDPKNAENAIEIVQHFVGEIPIFGICFGLQIISLALGAETYKLKFGHRGANQPVKDHEKDIVYITAQNHGFAVDENSLEDTGLEVIQTNPNDNTVEGVRDDYLDILTVQYHPEACPGPKDVEEKFFGKVRKILEG
ncbi:carbamoyl phosphate synthase small subunit [archaeon SCG-AAA382B04]|nr:carbamoyl phosphate synthase small subunit [archaeon SCG-AAA382B04]